MLTGLYNSMVEIIETITIPTLHAYLVCINKCTVQYSSRMSVSGVHDVNKNVNKSVAIVNNQTTTNYTRHGGRGRPAMEGESTVWECIFLTF